MVEERSGRGRLGAGNGRPGRAMERQGGGRGIEPPPGRRSVPPTPPERYRYTMAELEEQTGLNARTIRYYVSQGLIPAAHGRGPSATYDLGHLLRLKAIQLLKAEYRPLEEIKARLGELSDKEIAALLEVETAPPEDRWRRVLLHPDIELHVRERGGRGRDAALDDAVDLIIGLVRPVIDRLEGTR